MRTYATIVAVATLTAIFSSVALIADTPAANQTYIKTSSDNRFVFVMIPPREEIEPRPGSRVAEIHRLYQRSGLYRKDDSTVPL